MWYSVSSFGYTATLRKLVFHFPSIEWDMIVVTVFLSIFWTKCNSIWFRIERKIMVTVFLSIFLTKLISIWFKIDRKTVITNTSFLSVDQPPVQPLKSRLKNQDVGPKFCHYSQTTPAWSILNPFYTWCTMLLTGLHHSPVVNIPLLLHYIFSMYSLPPPSPLPFSSN